MQGCECVWCMGAVAAAGAEDALRNWRDNDLCSIFQTSF